MITGITNGKHYQSIYHANVNVNLMEENVIQMDERWWNNDKY